MHSTTVNEAFVLSIWNTYLTIFELKFFILAPCRLDHEGYLADLVLIYSYSYIPFIRFYLFFLGICG